MALCLLFISSCSVDRQEPLLNAKDSGVGDWDVIDKDRDKDTDIADEFVEKPTVDNTSIPENETPLSQFLTTNPYSAENPSLIFDVDLGNTSTSLSQFKTHNDRKYFVGRKANADASGAFSIVLFEMVDIGNNKMEMVEKKIILDTAVRPPPTIHGGNFRITTAYEPYLEFYDGRHWLAFECHGPDFEAHKSEMNIGLTSVGVCMGPLDQNKELILNETRVMIAGGGPVGSLSKLSASVPKLLSVKDKLFLYWTSVKQNTHNAFRDKRVRDATYFKYNNMCKSPDDVVQCQYKALVKEVDRELIPISYNEYRYDKNCLDKITITGCREIDDFHSWQARIINRITPYEQWMVSADGSGLEKSEEYQRDPGVLRFVDLESFGAEVFFRGAQKLAYLEAGTDNFHQVALAYDQESFHQILKKTTFESDASQSRVADMFDVKRHGNAYYFTFALGGASTQTDYAKDFYCTSSSVGVSDIGCYRFAVFKSDSPLGDLRMVGEREEINLNYPGYGELKPGISYPRYFIHPTNHKTYLSAKFQGPVVAETFPTGEYPKILEMTASLGRYFQNKIEKNDTLTQGMRLLSNNGKFELLFNQNGLQIRNNWTKQITFSVDKTSVNPELTLQPDGNLVYRTDINSPTVDIWSAGTRTMNPNTYVILQNDGNLVQYERVNGVLRSLWNSNSEM